MKKNSSFVRYFLPVILLALIIATAGIGVKAADEPFRQYLPFAVSSPDTFSWIGPEGGTVTALLADPRDANILYAGTRGAGVFKTTNGGASWFAANKNITTKTIHVLAIDPSKSSTLYAGTDGQVLKSTDGGATWTTLAWPSGTTTVPLVYALAVNPGNPDLVYAGTRTQGTSNGVLYISYNGGTTWDSKSFTNNWMNSITVDPLKPNIVLAAMENSAPYMHTDYGKPSGWGLSAISNGEKNYTGAWVGYDPRSGTNQAFYASETNSFYRSTTDGSTWNQVDNYLGSSLISRNGAVIYPRSPNTIYLANSSGAADQPGVYRTDDLGTTWYGAGLKGKKVNALAMPTSTLNTIYAGVENEGVYKSTDGGKNWVRSSIGLGTSYVTGMAFKDNKTFFAGTYGGGVFKTTDAGATWSAFNTNLPDLYINGLVQHPTNTSTIYALTSNSGLWKADMTTGTWSTAGGLPAAFEEAYAPMRDDPATALTTTAVGVNDLVFAPSNANIAYLATSGGLFKSIDSAATFPSTPAGLVLPGEFVKSVTVNVTDANIVYAVTNATGLIKRADDGGASRSWQSITLPTDQSQTTVNVVAMWSGLTDSVAVGSNNGVWFYNGTSFEAAGLQGYTVTSLAADPASPGLMVAGTTKGVFYSTDHKNWSPAGTAAGTLNVASLNFNAADKWTLYVGTADRGTVKLSFVH